MKLWQLYACLALAIAGTLGVFTLIGTPTRQVAAACQSPADEIVRDACAVLGR